jgi:hypothetical protein
LKDLKIVDEEKDEVSVEIPLVDASARYSGESNSFEFYLRED